jgi:hypothetical protein
MNDTHIRWYARATAAIGRPAVLLGAPLSVSMTVERDVRARKVT